MIKTSYATVCLFVFALVIPAFGQDLDQLQRIESRLEQVRKIKTEETNTIKLLQSQLKSTDEENLEQLRRLQSEITSATDRVAKLNALETQLQDLMAVVAKQDAPNNNNALDNRDRDPDKRQPLLRRVGSDSLEAPKADPKRDDSVRDRAPWQPKDESRLDHLMNSKRALEQAGEFEMAHKVDQLIRRERERLERVGDNIDGGESIGSPHEGGVAVPDQLPPPDNRTELDRKIGRVGGVDPVQQPKEKPKRELRRVGGGDGAPDVEVDLFPIPGNLDDGDSKKNSDEVEDLKSLIKEMRSELKRLQEEVDSMKKDNGGR